MVLYIRALRNCFGSITFWISNHHVCSYFSCFCSQIYFYMLLFETSLAKLSWIWFWFCFFLVKISTSMHHFPQMDPSPRTGNLQTQLDPQADAAFWPLSGKPYFYVVLGKLIYGRRFQLVIIDSHIAHFMYPSFTTQNLSSKVYCRSSHVNYRKSFQLLLFLLVSSAMERCGTYFTMVIRLKGGLETKHGENLLQITSL